MSYEKFEKSKRYKEFMKDNGAQLLYDKYYSELNNKEKSKVAKFIAGDKKHNQKDAKKILKEK